VFGYIRVFKPNLTFREYEQYRAVYCSLCETLAARYGFAARMTLSYDFTFLALFRMALHKEDPSFYIGHCPYKPLKKHLFCKTDRSDALAYAADVSVLLTYHKLCDTVNDERFFKKNMARVLRFILKRDFKKAVERRPDEAEWASEYMLSQEKVEKTGSASIDAAAHPTAHFLSQLAASGFPEDENKTHAERFGYCLGRFIYLADAADDTVSDHKSGSYNVYNLAYPHGIVDGKRLPELNDMISQTLHNTVAVCAESLEELPINRFDSILQNIIYGGMPSVIHRILHPKQKETSYEESV